jgi:molecular chaperone DnaJ
VAALEIEIPRGVESGMYLQCRNQGDLGDFGTERGALRIRLTLKTHPHLERRHNDLIYRAKVAASAVGAGAELSVPTLDGARVITIPRATRSGDIVRIKGAGMPDIGGAHRGDLFVEIMSEEPEIDSGR